VERRGAAQGNSSARERQARPRIEEGEEEVTDADDEREADEHERDQEDREADRSGPALPSLEHLPEKDRHDPVPESREEDHAEELSQSARGLQHHRTRLLGLFALLGLDEAAA